jgi:hypothetical protein
MIDIVEACGALERLPYTCGAYLSFYELVSTPTDAIHIHEMREQVYAQMLGYV